MNFAMSGSSQSPIGDDFSLGPQRLRCIGQLPQSAGTGYLTSRRRWRTAGSVSDLMSAPEPVLGNLGQSLTSRIRVIPADAGDAHRRRRLLVQDLADLLVTVDPGAPVLTILEDLHWADELSLDVLGHLAGRISNRPMLVAGAYRSDEPSSSDRERATGQGGKGAHRASAGPAHRCGWRLVRRDGFAAIAVPVHGTLRGAASPSFLILIARFALLRREGQRRYTEIGYRRRLRLQSRDQPAWNAAAFA
jgi:hypothetical protein